MPKQENPLGFLKGSDHEFNTAMDSLDVMFDDMYKPQNKQVKQDYMDQKQFQWMDGMYNDIMEPSDSEKQMKYQNLLNIQAKREIMQKQHIAEEEKRKEMLLKQQQQQKQDERSVFDDFQNPNSRQQNQYQHNFVMGQPVVTPGSQNYNYKYEQNGQPVYYPPRQVSQQDYYADNSEMSGYDIPLQSVPLLDSNNQYVNYSTNKQSFNCYNYDYPKDQI